MTATMTQANIASQLNVYAPAAISFRGKSYSRSQMLIDVDGISVRQDYIGRKSRGAFIADKVTFSVTYHAASDTYLVASTHFDGATLDSAEIKRTEGVYSDGLELLALMC